VVAQDGSAHQIEPRGGRRSRTELDVSVASDTGIAIGTDGAVRIPGRDDGIICLGPTGTERWRITGEGGFPGELTVDAAGLTLGVSDTGKLLAIDPSGNVVWEVSLQARAQAAPILGPDGTIYVATARGTIQAWR
jgi:outer membrane protein assembly factor BamB